MNTFVRLFCTAVVGLIVGVPAAEGHTFMRKPFQKKYDLKSVSCYTCHIKGKDKEIVTEFGKTLKTLLKGKEITARMKAVKGADRKAKKEVEEECTKDLVEALKKLDKMKTPSGKSYPEAIKAGDVEGAKPKGSKDDDEDEEEEEEDE